MPLLLGAGVHGHQGAAVFFDDLRKEQSVLAVLPTEADLGCDRQVKYTCQTLDDPGDFQRCAHQPSSSTAAGNRAVRAAHVDVNAVRTGFLQPGGSLEESIRLVSIDLDEYRTLFFCELDLLLNVMGTVQHILSLDELGIADRGT